MSWDSTPAQRESASYLSRPGGRRPNFRDYLRDKARDHLEARYYLDKGSWMADPRPPGLDEGHLRTEDRHCYYNAQTSMGPDHSYAEGYAVTDDGAIAHAWLMNGGSPVELSPSMQDMDVDYYGVRFPDDLVRRTMMERGTAEPIVEVVA